MILLDTNVVSAMMKPAFEPAIDIFCQAHSTRKLHLPSIVIAEIRYGIQRVPPGRCRDETEQNFFTFLSAGFSARIVHFDDVRAKYYAIARATRDRAGRPVSAEDALIGGMALAYGAILATRNTADFEGYGLRLVNP